jgi:hypothetical protein
VKQAPAARAVAECERLSGELASVPAENEGLRSELVASLHAVKTALDQIVDAGVARDERGEQETKELQRSVWELSKLVHEQVQCRNNELATVQVALTTAAQATMKTFDRAAALQIKGDELREIAAGNSARDAERDREVWDLRTELARLNQELAQGRTTDLQSLNMSLVEAARMTIEAFTAAANQRAEMTATEATQRKTTARLRGKVAALATEVTALQAEKAVRSSSRARRPSGRSVCLRSCRRVRPLARSVRRKLPRVSRAIALWVDASRW